MSQPQHDDACALYSKHAVCIVNHAAIRSRTKRSYDDCCKRFLLYIVSAQYVYCAEGYHLDVNSRSAYVYWCKPALCAAPRSQGSRAARGRVAMSAGLTLCSK